MDLLRKLFWVVLTAAFTFAFVVLFENGTVNYVDNARREFTSLKAMVMPPPDKKKADEAVKP